MNRVPAAALALLAVLAGPFQAAAKDTPKAAGAAATTAAEGFSAERLARMKTVMQGLVDSGELPGLVTYMARNGKVVDHSAYGVAELGGKSPMKTDTIFRIASMTKLVTSVAVMMLVEEGRFLPRDPVSRFLPEFASVRVATAGGALVPPKRPITIEDLLTHRSGITYGFIDEGQVGDTYRRLGVADGLAEADITTEESIKRLASAPLVSQPGEEWRYGLGIDVLGRLVEVVSGQDLETFFRTRIFEPLKMPDSSFVLSEAKWDRLAGVVTAENPLAEPREATSPRPAGASRNGKLRPMKDPEKIETVLFSPHAYYRPGKKYLSGGAGLLSTASDYGRFLQMLLNGGELDSARILGPKTVELMTVSHTAELKDAPGDGAGFGLGVGVVTDLGGTKLHGSVGAYSWGGIYGSTYWVDPKEKLIGVLMAQRYPYGNVHWTDLFQAMVYQAILR